MLWNPRLPFIHVKQCNATQPILLHGLKTVSNVKGEETSSGCVLISSGKSSLSADHRESINSDIGQWKINPVPHVTSYFEDSRFSLDYDGTSIFERDEKCIEQRQDSALKLTIVWKLKFRILFSLRSHLRENFILSYSSLKIWNDGIVNFNIHTQVFKYLFSFLSLFFFLKIFKFESLVFDMIVIDLCSKF